MIDAIKSVLQQEWFWAMMQFLIVTATLIPIYRQVRVQAATHVVQALSTIHTRWNSDSMVRARYKVCCDWLKGERRFDGVDQYVAEFMEELGIYSQTKAVPDNFMWEAQSWYIEHYFCMFENPINEFRGTYHDENFYIQFQQLYERMNRISRKKNSPSIKRGEADLKRFAEYEMQITTALLDLKAISTTDKPLLKTEPKKRLKTSS